MNTLGALTVASAWHYIRKRFGLETAVLAALNLVTMPLFFKTFSYFDNPSFTPLFVMLACLGLARAFAEGEARGWWLAAICTAATMQIQAAGGILILAGVILQFGARRLRVQALPWRDFLIGALLFGLCLLPYGIWLLLQRFGIEWGQVSSALPIASTSNLDQLRHGMFRPIQRALILELTQSKLLRLLSLPFALFFVFFSFYVWRTRQMVTDEMRVSARTLRVWGICSAVTFLPALLGFYLPSRPRYGIPFALAVALTVAAWAASRFDRARVRFWAALILIAQILVILDPVVVANDEKGYRFAQLNQLPLAEMAIAFVCVLICYGLSFGRFRRLGYLLVFGFLPTFSFQSTIGVTGRPGLGLTLSEFHAMSRAVIDATGWSWEEARERLFYMNVHYQRSPQWIYRDLEKAGRAKAHKTSPLPDGYFVASDSHENPGLRRHFQRWMMGHDLAADIAYAWQDGRIETGEPLTIGRAVLVPYYVPDKTLFLSRFQNFGIQYDRDFSRPPTAAAEIRERLSSTHIRARFNDCPTRIAFCEILYDVERTQGDDGRYLLHVHLNAEVLAESSSWFFPEWNQALNSPYLARRCKNSNDQTRLEIVSQVGFSNGALFDHLMNGQLLAPLDRTFVDPCQNKDGGRLSLGYKSAFVLVDRTNQHLPGRRIVFTDF